MIFASLRLLAKAIAVVLELALVVGACAGPGLTSPTPVGNLTASVPAFDESALPSTHGSADARAPVCNDKHPTWVEQAASKQNGPDSAGRIVFGQISRADTYGQTIGPMFAIDPDGSDLVQLLDCEIERPRFSPDGKRLAFSMYMDDGTWQVATSAADGSDLLILTHTVGWAETPDWGPDGNWLVFALSDERCITPDCDRHGFHWSTWRMEADGSNQRLIGDPNASDWEPRLSPDGTKVITLRYKPFVRDLATGTERPVTSGDPTAEHADWSRDGRFIVYNTQDQEGLSQVKLAPADDEAAAPVVLYGDADHFGYKPAFSPDGSRIVFGCNGAMCLMNADGSHVVELLAAPGLELNHFAWGVTPGH